MRVWAKKRIAQHECHLKNAAGARANCGHARRTWDQHRIIIQQQPQKTARRRVGFALAAVGLLTTGPALLRLPDLLK